MQIYVETESDIELTLELLEKLSRDVKEEAWKMHMTVVFPNKGLLKSFKTMLSSSEMKEKPHIKKPIKLNLRVESNQSGDMI